MATTYTNVSNKDNITLPQEHKTVYETTRGFYTTFYTIGIEDEVYRTNGSHSGYPIGIFIGYISAEKRGKLKPFSIDPATDEWLVDKEQLPLRAITMDYEDCFHMILRSLRMRHVRIVLPQSLEMRILVSETPFNLHRQTNPHYRHQRYQALHQHPAIHGHNLKLQKQ